MIKFVEELFYFYPEKFGYIPESIDEVYLIGEFNEWGKDIKKLESFKLTMDKTGRWIGLVKVPTGRGLYKFLLNKNTLCPDMGHFCYSTASTPEWSKKAVWYQIMVDRFYNGDSTIHAPNLISWDSPPDYFNNFGGDLAGIQQKIPYLNDIFGSLKDKALYLNPLHKSLASNHKYWPEDFDTIDPQFGSEEDLKNLIDELHKYEIKNHN
jgi:Glycosidases